MKGLLQRGQKWGEAVLESASAVRGARLLPSTPSLLGTPNVPWQPGGRTRTPGAQQRGPALPLADRLWAPPPSPEARRGLGRQEEEKSRQACRVRRLVRKPARTGAQPAPFPWRPDGHPLPTWGSLLSPPPAPASPSGLPCRSPDSRKPVSGLGVAGTRRSPGRAHPRRRAMAFPRVCWARTGSRDAGVAASPSHGTCSVLGGSVRPERPPRWAPGPCRGA